MVPTARAPTLGWTLISQRVMAGLTARGGLSHSESRRVSQLTVSRISWRLPELRAGRPTEGTTRQPFVEGPFFILPPLTPKVDNVRHAQITVSRANLSPTAHLQLENTGRRRLQGVGDMLWPSSSDAVLCHTYNRSCLTAPVPAGSARSR